LKKRATKVAIRTIFFSDNPNFLKSSGREGGQKKYFFLEEVWKKSLQKISDFSPFFPLNL
jgi:hypothetical protein